MLYLLEDKNILLKIAFGIHIYTSEDYGITH